MSDFFVSKFNKKTGCAHCKSGKLVVGNKTYSLCANHLKDARDHWRKWAVERRSVGRCISCDRLGWRGGKRINVLGRRIPGGERWLRCKEHTLANREKCARWVEARRAADPNYDNRRWEERKKKFTENGLCVGCKEHRPLPAGFKRCDKCRARYEPKGAR